MQDYDNAVSHFETAMKLAQDRSDEAGAKSLETALGVHTLFGRPPQTPYASNLRHELQSYPYIAVQRRRARSRGTRRSATSRPSRSPRRPVARMLLRGRGAAAARERRPHRRRAQAHRRTRGHPRTPRSPATRPAPPAQAQPAARGPPPKPHRGTAHRRRPNE